MPNTFKEFQKYLQFLTSWEQITEINHMIHDILLLLHNNLNDDINKKCCVIKELNIKKKQLLRIHNDNNKT